jgi:hypothetical protein
VCSHGEGRSARNIVGIAGSVKIEELQVNYRYVIVSGRVSGTAQVMDSKSNYTVIDSCNFARNYNFPGSM